MLTRTVYNYRQLRSAEMINDFIDFREGKRENYLTVQLVKHRKKKLKVTF